MYEKKFYLYAKVQKVWPEKKKDIFREETWKHSHFQKNFDHFHYFQKKKSSMSSYFACRSWCMKKKFYLYSKIQKIRPGKRDIFEKKKENVLKMIMFSCFFLVSHQKNAFKMTMFSWCLFSKMSFFLRLNFLNFCIQMKFFFHTSIFACEIWTHWWFFFENDKNDQTLFENDYVFILFFEKCLLSSQVELFEFLHINRIFFSYINLCMRNMNLSIIEGYIKRMMMMRNGGCLQKLLAKMRSNDESKWWEQMIKTNDESKWWRQMVVANDNCK